jgi:hypothetical protein
MIRTPLCDRTELRMERWRWRNTVTEPYLTKEASAR